MFLDEIAARLVSQGVGALGTTIFLSSTGQIPDGDGPFLTVIETGGSGPARTQNNTATQRPTAQIAVRGLPYTTARAMAKAAYDAVGGANGLHNIELSGVKYLSVTARQELSDIGLDGAGRPTVVFNIDAEKAPS